MKQALTAFGNKLFTFICCHTEGEENAFEHQPHKALLNNREGTRWSKDQIRRKITRFFTEICLCKCCAVADKGKTKSANVTHSFSGFGVNVVDFEGCIPAASCYQFSFRMKRDTVQRAPKTMKHVALKTLISSECKGCYIQFFA